MAAAVGLVLADQEGIEGGVWQPSAGSLAYAFPAYEGTGPKTDLPAAERDPIEVSNDQAARDGLIRAMSGSPPVAILTAIPTGENTVEAMRLGALDHLAKPIRCEGLRDLMERLVSVPMDFRSPRRRMKGISSAPVLPSGVFRSRWGCWA